MYPINLYVTRTYERAIRKLRWAGSGRGKRGGIRAIYFWRASAEANYILTAYAKSDRDDLTAADRKAAMVGSTVVLADRWYPSSKTCSCCGSVAPGLDLSQRIYRCGSCGLEIDRDLNAARNLEGLAASSAATACGGTRSGAPATRPRVGTGRVQRVPSKQEPDRNAPASGRGQPAQLYAEAGKVA